jgi:CO/xanthine dehydrogenase Mo-binding subunit
MAVGEREAQGGLVGRRLPRVDAGAYVRGEAQYATDLTLAGLLHCRLLYSPHAHARIVRVDTTAARALPGVEAVVTGADHPELALLGTCLAARPLLARDRVRCVGDVIAAVAAVDEATAQRAVERIEVDYEALPAVTTVAAARAADAPQVHEEKAGYKTAAFIQPYVVREAGNESVRFRVRRGDVAAAKATAAVVVRERFTTQRIEHFSLEPHAAVVRYDASTGKLTVWSSSGKPFRTVQQLAGVLGLPHSRVHVIYMPTGGDFGGKGEVTIEPFCALLAMATGRPVKGVYSREEEFFAATCKTPFEIDLTLGLDREGRLVCLEGDLTVDTGAYNSMPAMVTIHAATHLEGPYTVPHVAVDARCVFTHNTMSGSFRGFGAPQVAFARESLLDDAARRLGLDPLEVRRRNAWGPGAITCTGQVLDPAHHSVTVRETLEAAAAASGWSAWRAARPAASGRRRRGLGIAAAHHGIGGSIWAGADAAVTFLKANPDGTVTIISGTADVGQGINTSLMQLVGETLQLPLSAIGFAAKDTDVVPQDAGASASRNMYVAGNATRLAALDLQAKLVEIAATLLEADAADVEYAQGRMFVRGVPGRACTIEEAVAYAMRYIGEQPLGIGKFMKPTVSLNAQGEGSPFQSFDFATQVAEVEVDLDTGEVQVLRLVNAQDAGRAINPLIVEGQIHGGMMMGLGYALMEEVVCQDGQVLNPHAFDYRVPRAEDLPQFDIVLLETPDPIGPFGGKGVGEIGMNPTAAAIANAVADATGVRVTSLPITPEKLALRVREREHRREERHAAS